MTADLERAARAIRRYEDGAHMRAGAPTDWNIYDTANDGWAFVETHHDRKERDRRLDELNASAALSAVFLDPSDEVVEAYWDGYMAARMADPMVSEFSAIRAALRAAAMKILGRQTGDTGNEQP